MFKYIQKSDLKVRKKSESVGSPTAGQWCQLEDFPGKALEQTGGVMRGMALV